MSATTPPSSGIGVIDTSTFWASGRVLSGDAAPENREYFLSLAHNLILYDQLRTDFDVLGREDEHYRDLVNAVVGRLGHAVRIDPMPAGTADDEIIEAISDVFLDRLKNGKIDIENQARHALLRNPAVLARRISEVAYNRVEFAQFATDKPATDPIEHLAREITVTARTIRYAGHSSFVQKQEGTPSAFCALPGRIGLLRDFLGHEHLAQAWRGAPKGYLDLIARLGLPTNGYDFSGLVAKPLSLTDLGRAIKDLPADEALDRVLEIRKTDAAIEVRRVWASRLWGAGSHALEGYGMGQQMYNIAAGGDVIQNNFQLIGVRADQHLPLHQAPMGRLTEEAREWLLRALQKS
jgi:hypothetical protein